MKFSILGLAYLTVICRIATAQHAEPIPSPNGTSPSAISATQIARQTDQLPITFTLDTIY
ncbi:hypothetical protein [Spirosoma koreense]